MKEYILQGKEITDRKNLHGQLAASMEFPEWYGNNLDALSDVLTDIGEDTTLIVADSAVLMTTLGEYGERFLRVLKRAQQENAYFFYELR